MQVDLLSRGKIALLPAQPEKSRFLNRREDLGGGAYGADSRIRLPLIRRGKAGTLQPADPLEALEKSAAGLHDRRRAIGIGSPRASMESNYALRRLVGPERFFLGISAEDRRTTAAAIRILRANPARPPSLKEVREADTVLILGEAIAGTAPHLADALRRIPDRPELGSVQSIDGYAWPYAAAREIPGNPLGSLYIAAPARTELDDMALRTHYAGPDDLARFGFAIARAIDSRPQGISGLPGKTARLAEEIAAALSRAKNPLIITGAGCGSEALLEAAANVAGALCGRGKAALLSIILPEANNLGLGLMDGGDLDSALQLLRNGDADTVVILENDLTLREDPAAVAAALNSARRVILIDHTLHETALLADVVFPAATIVEESGTLVDGDGHARRFHQVLLPGTGVQSSRRWLDEMELAVCRFDRAAGGVLLNQAAQAPRMRPVLQLAPPAELRIQEGSIPHFLLRSRNAFGAANAARELTVADESNPPIAVTIRDNEAPAPSARIPRPWVTPHPGG